MKNKEHWDNQAKKHKGELKATTMTDTIKRLELATLEKAMRDMNKDNILEVGCGNGVNLKYLVEKFPDAEFTGMDYSAEMLKNAYKHKNITYICDDILSPKHKGKYDIVFTDRCLINMQSIEEQIKAFNNVVQYAISEGYIIIIENMIQGIKLLNKFRNVLGYKDKRIAPFNKYIDEIRFLRGINKRYTYTVYNYNFASLHDLILYVLNYNGKKVNYEAPIMKRVTELILKCPEVSYGDWGQNKIRVWRKR